MCARVLIEMNIRDDFPIAISFENEYSELVSQPILYDWKQPWCKICEQLGYVEE